MSRKVKKVKYSIVEWIVIYFAIAVLIICLLLLAFFPILGGIFVWTNIPLDWMVIFNIMWLISIFVAYKLFGDEPKDR